MPKNPHREPLDSAWAAALLATPSMIEVGKPVSVVLDEARAHMEKSVAEARAILEGHPFNEVIAEAAAKRAGCAKKGSRLVLGDDGVVYLEGPLLADPLSKALLPIGELRALAHEFGIDPVPFGRSKTKLLKAIQNAQIKNFQAMPGDLQPKEGGNG